MNKKCSSDDHSSSVSLTPKKVKRTDQAALMQRLKRVEGQVRGLQQMLQDERYCIDILTQIAAAKAALDAVADSLLHHHVQHCVQQAVHDGEGAAALQELMTVLTRVLRR